MLAEAWSQATQIPYLRQLVKVAGSHLAIEFAVNVDRMQVRCNKCDVSIILAVPETTTIDYSFQQFLSIHGHNGGHNDPPITQTDKKWPPAKAVTRDFKDGKPTQPKQPKHPKPGLLKIATGRKFR